jgi:CTP-dependent riboflavin kinase
MSHQGLTIRVSGVVSHGVIRGRELVERFADRLTGVVGWRPYPGTLNVKLEKPLDVHYFEIQRIEHVLLDGSVWIDARLAPAKLRYKDQEIGVWWIREERGLHEEDIIELIAPDRLMDKYKMQYGDAVDLELYQRTLSLRQRLHLWRRSIMPKGRVVK